MISDISLINGICAFILISIAFFTLILYFRLYIKTETRNFINLTILSIAIFIGWLGITISFFSVLIFGENFPELTLIANITAFAPEPFGAFAIINSNWSLFGSPKHKKLVLAIFAIVSIIYYIFLYLTFNQAIVCPDVAAGEILNNWLSPQSFLYYIFMGLIFIAVLITAGGFFKFGKLGVAFKRKSYYVIMASGLIGFGIFLDTVIFGSILPQELDFISRILLIPGMIFGYFGFRPLK